MSKPGEEFSGKWPLICAGARHSEVVPFPRLLADGSPVCYLRIRNLTLAEVGQATARAHARSAAAIRASDPTYKGEISRESQAYRDVFEQFAALEQLKRACRDLDDPSKPFFPAADAEHAPKTAIEAVLVQEEIASLYQRLMVFRIQTSPDKYSVDDAQIDQLVKRMEAGEDPTFFLSGLKLDLVIRLAPLLILKLCSSLRDKYGSGSSADQATTS